MKKILLALLSFVVLSANAQTVEEVIQKYAANLGGLDAFNKLKTAKFTGSISGQGTEAKMTIYVVNGSAVRSDIEVMGSKISNSYKDGNGWQINPLTGNAAATDLTGAPLAELKMQTRLAPILMDYKSLGHTVVLDGQEDVEGTKTFKVKLTTKDDNKVTTYYISTKDYSLIKSVSDREFQGQTFSVESWYSDLKEFGGAKFFMSRIQKVEGQEIQAVKLETVEPNITVDAKMFDKP